MRDSIQENTVLYAWKGGIEEWGTNRELIWFDLASGENADVGRLIIYIHIHIYIYIYSRFEVQSTRRMMMNHLT